MGFNLEDTRIIALPEDAFYISDFITEDEEDWLLQKVKSAPLPRWTQLSHRRLQTWPSALTKSNALLASPLPAWLRSPIVEPRFEALHIFKDTPHKVYQPGQGIMPHEDGAAYYPLVATVSLCFCTTSTHRATGKQAERRSLLITRGKVYTDLLHGIEQTTIDEDLGPHSICNWELLREREPYQSGWYERKMRTSLTYRDVLHIVKMGNTLKFLGGR
ncbi:hypothetical protein PDIDSM_6788 [Penicillium digitatum]|nr:hypothetical protein PDIDSM_6788 [Penicillium digitatum]